MHAFIHPSFFIQIWLCIHTLELLLRNNFVNSVKTPFMKKLYFFIYFRLLQCSDQSEENIDTQSTQSSHLRGSTPKIWNHHTTSWRNGANNSISPTTQLSETKLSPGRIEQDHDEKPKKTKQSKLCLILWYRKKYKMCFLFVSALLIQI